MYDPSKSPVLQDMARKQLERLPDHELQALEDQHLLEGNTIQAESVADIRTRKNQKQAKAVESDSGGYNNRKDGHESPFPVEADCPHCDWTGTYFFIFDCQQCDYSYCYVCESPIDNHDEECDLSELVQDLLHSMISPSD